MLFCNEAGRVNVLLNMIDLVEWWLREVDTDPILAQCMIQYAHGQGAVSMQSLCEELDTRFQCMARSQDMIGWQWFMEGMISWGVVEIQHDYLQVSGARWKLD